MTGNPGFWNKDFSALDSSHPWLLEHKLGVPELSEEHHELFLLLIFSRGLLSGFKASTSQRLQAALMREGWNIMTALSSWRRKL